jgi:hypothetical protein
MLVFGDEKLLSSVAGDLTIEIFVEKSNRDTMSTVKLVAYTH